MRLEVEGAMDYVAALRGARIFKTHSYPVETWADHVKFISIFRDPRDVLVSSAFYLANIPEERGGWGEAFAASSPQQRLIRLIRDGEFCISRLERWYRTPGVLQISYERLKTEPLDTLRMCQDFLGLQISVGKLEDAISAHSFRRQSGRNAGTANSTAFLRKGIIGDWKNYFDDELRELFKFHANGRWGSLLIDMGYEAGNDW